MAISRVQILGMAHPSCLTVESLHKSFTSIHTKRKARTVKGGGPPRPEMGRAHRVETSFPQTVSHAVHSTADLCAGQPTLAEIQENIERTPPTPATFHQCCPSPPWPPDAPQRVERQGHAPVSHNAPALHNAVGILKTPRSSAIAMPG